MGGIVHGIDCFSFLFISEPLTGIGGQRDGRRRENAAEFHIGACCSFPNVVPAGAGIVEPKSGCRVHRFSS